MSLAKTPQEVLDKCRFDYETGNFKSVYELADRYGINKSSLHARVNRENWEASRLKRLEAMQMKVEETREKLTENYLLNTFKRAKKYEKLIDVSMENLGSKDSEGNPLLDPDALTSYTQAETRIHELAKSALRIPDAKSLDITTRGQSLGESWASAIEKLRSNDRAPKLDENDLNRILEAEIVDDKQTPL